MLKEIWCTAELHGAGFEVCRVVGEQWCVSTSDGGWWMCMARREREEVT